jgi:hypothetical protein
LRHSALHLSFLLVRLGGFATDYFRGHLSACALPGSAGRAAAALGEADARLITIGELDASRLIKKICKTTPCKVGLWLSFATIINPPTWIRCGFNPHSSDDALC